MFGVNLKSQSSPKYSNLRDEDDVDSLDSDREHYLPSKQGPSINWHLTINAILFVVSVSIRVAVQLTSPKVTREGCVQDMYLDASIIEDMPYSWVSYADFFYPQWFPSKSVYRGKADEELERAWSNFTLNKVVAIPEKKVRKMGKAIPENAKTARYSDGVSVAAILAGHYQMNCLNLIRPYTYYTDSRYTHLYKSHPLLGGHHHEDGGEEGDKHQEPVALRERLDHCIETIRERLTCTGDITPYLMWNSNDEKMAVRADLGSEHLCRSWDDFLAWTEFNEMRGAEDPTATKLDLWY